MLRRISNKIKRTIWNKPQVAQEQIYLNNGNLSVGRNTDITGLKIVIYGAIPGQQNIIIGDDCMLEGTIVLYNANAKIKIGNRVFFGHNSLLCSYDEIEIGDDVMISWGCTIMDTNAHSLVSREREMDVLNWKKGWEFKDWSNVESKKILIDSKSWIGFNSIVMKGVILSEGCVVASGSVVSKSFDSYSILGGNPAVFIKKTS